MTKKQADVYKSERLSSIITHQYSLPKADDRIHKLKSWHACLCMMLKRYSCFKNFLERNLMFHKIMCRAMGRTRTSFPNDSWWNRPSWW